MKVGDLVTIDKQPQWGPMLVLEKSWIKGEWIMWSAEIGKLVWRGSGLEVVSEGR